MDISIMIEGQDGLTWARWQRLAAAVEQLGFAGLFRSDHFTNSEPPNKDSLEMVVSLAYLANSTQRIHFGPCVAPVSFRDPIMFARQELALDDLSHGRMILGVGAGWQEREHSMFGYALGDVPTRMARFEEALETITRLLRGTGPVSFSGRFFHLHEAELLPCPQRNGDPPIMIGGNGPKRTLPLVARYADIWNAVFVRPEEFQASSAALDELLRAVGRPPEAVRRTLMTGIFFGNDQAALNVWLDRLRARDTILAGLPNDEVVARVRAARPVIIGRPEQVREQLATYAAAGVHEIMLQWLDMDDIDGLHALAEVVHSL